MHIKDIKDVEVLKDAVKHCEGNVYLKSIYGDCFNLKSALSLYVAIGTLLGEHGDELELFCDRKSDEIILIDMLTEHPEMI